jgi:hypothetical protein
VRPANADASSGDFERFPVSSSARIRPPMKKLILAGLAAIALLPAIARAQPYDGNQSYSDDPRYGDQRDNDNPPPRRAPPPANWRGDPDRADQDDGGWSDQDRADNDADRDDYASSRYEGYRSVYSGRTGASWRDAEGRSCQWREVVRRDNDGYDAYKWVPVCRD